MLQIQILTLNLKPKGVLCVMKDFAKLDELIEKLHDSGSLSDAEMQELESILLKDDEAREYFFLQEELHTMLEVDKSIRLSMATELLPENVVPLPGSRVPCFAVKTPQSRLEEVRANERKAAAKQNYRMVMSVVAMIAGVFALLWIFNISNRFIESANQNQPTSPTDNGSLASTNKGANEVAEISFHETVQPILADHCLGCHGEDEKARKANLRLDVASTTLEGSEPVIVRGDPDASELVARISSVEPDYMMPPPDSGKVLSEQDIAILRLWIEQGANYGSAWSSVPTYQFFNREALIAYILQL